MHREKDLSTAKKIYALRKRLVDRFKVLSIARKICASRKRFVDCEKVLSIVKKICRLPKRFVDCEKDLSIVKKICRSGFNLFLCFALLGFRSFTVQLLFSLHVKKIITGRTAVCETNRKARNVRHQHGFLPNSILPLKKLKQLLLS